MKMKVRNIKCKTSKNTYPNCHCNECIQNITEFNGIKINTVYSWGLQSVYVVSFCPFDSCADVFFNNYHPDVPDNMNMNGQKYGWISNTEELSLN
jgi:hypothetical protein